MSIFGARGGSAGFCHLHRFCGGAGGVRDGASREGTGQLRTVRCGFVWTHALVASISVRCCAGGVPPCASMRHGWRGRCARRRDGTPSQSFARQIQIVRLEALRETTHPASDGPSAHRGTRQDASVSVHATCRSTHRVCTGRCPLRWHGETDSLAPANDARECVVSHAALRGHPGDHTSTGACQRAHAPAAARGSAVTPPTSARTCTHLRTHARVGRSRSTGARTTPSPDRRTRRHDRPRRGVLSGSARACHGRPIYSISGQRASLDSDRLWAAKDSVQETREILGGCVRPRDRRCPPVPSVAAWRGRARGGAATCAMTVRRVRAIWPSRAASGEESLVFGAGALWRRGCPGSSVRKV